jgi:predicted TPR repeat methyltransferase
VSHKRKKRQKSLSAKRRTKNILPANKSASIDDALNTAVRYHQDGRLDRAEEVCKKALAISPNHPSALHLLGLISYQVGKTDAAIDLIAEAIRTDPHNAVYYNTMGNALTDQGKKDEAISFYRRALEVNPNLVEAHYNMGNVFHEEAKLDEAIACYRGAIQIEPDIAPPHNNMGNAFMAQGKLDEAVACYRRALEINPKLIEAYYNMGEVLRDQGKIDQAINYYRKAVELKPDYLEAHCNLGDALTHQGKLAEAAACFEKALELDPENSSAKHHLAAVTGQTTEAPPQEYIRKVFDHYSRKFERHVAEKLHYEIPSLLRRFFDGIVKNDLYFKNVIDLGCGTGLAGIEFRAMTDRLSGIDISPKMVEEAKKKNVYDVLLVADIMSFFNDTDEKYDIFIATDVLVYIGNLKGVFQSVQKHSLSNAYFLFSTESSARHDYVLRPTGRYAHSRSYVESLAEEHGFWVEMCQALGIRKERDQWIMGDIFILKAKA